MLSLLCLTIAAPAKADSQAANPEVAESLKRPRIAAALAMRNRMDAVAIARDMASIEATLAPEMILNGPNNRVNDRASIIKNIAAGLVGHGVMERTIEYAAERGRDVIFMGKETTRPRATNEGGKTAHRRFTDVWTETSDGWKLAMRQATVYETE
jgi:hypothetical protein